MSRERGLKAKIKLSEGYVLRYIHGYFHICKEPHEAGGLILISPARTSVKRFAKQCLRKDSQ